MQTTTEVEAPTIEHLDSTPTCNWVADETDDMCAEPAAWDCVCVLCAGALGTMCDGHRAAALLSTDVYFHYACVSEGTHSEITLFIPKAAS